MSFPAEQHLPALGIAWKCPAGETGVLCSETFQVLWFVSALMQWHGPGRRGAWLLLLVKAPLNTESERGKAQQLRWEGNMTPSKAVLSPLSGTDSPSVPRKESGRGEVMVPPHRDAIFLLLATWEKQKKGSISCFSQVHLSVISSAGCVSVCVCVKDNRKKHLVWLHSSHLLIMSLKAIVSDNLCF